MGAPPNAAATNCPRCPVAWRIGRHHRKGVKDYGKIELGGLGVERLQRRMVEGHTGGRIDHHPPSPTCSAAATNLGECTLDVAGAGQDHAPKAAWIGAAIISHPAV